MTMNLRSACDNAVASNADCETVAQMSLPALLYHVLVTRPEAVLRERLASVASSELGDYLPV